MVTKMAQTRPLAIGPMSQTNEIDPETYQVLKAKQFAHGMESVAELLSLENEGVDAEQVPPVSWIPPTLPRMRCPEYEESLLSLWGVHR